MKKIALSLLIATALAGVCPLLAATKSLTVSVRGQTAPDYHRTKLANGTFKPERYVVSNAGMFPGTTRDASVEKVPYSELAGVVARNLAAQQFYLAKTARDADLLIAIYWGTTVPFSDSRYNFAADRLSTTAKDLQMTTMADRISQQTGEIAAGGGGITGGMVNGSVSLLSSLEFGMARVELENKERDVANADNARILGYMDDINERRDMMPWADVGDLQHDLVSDVEEERYYIVIRAYDFKALQKDGKQIVRWTTRISVGAQGNAFDERLSQMVAAGANAFGQKQGLRRRFYGDPRVDLGETQFLGEASVPSAKASADDRAAKK